MNDSRATELLEAAEQAAAHLRGAEAGRWRDQIDADYDEYERALQWLLDQDRADEALRMCLALVDFWQYTDRVTIGREWLEVVLAARPAHDRLRAESLFFAGMLAFWQGDDVAVRASFDEALELGRRLDAPTETALALSGLARLALRDDVAQGEAYAREALATLDNVDDVRGRSNAAHVLGVAAQMDGRFVEAREWMLLRLGYADQLNNVHAYAAEAANLSAVELALGNPARARELADEALSTAVQIGDAWMTPYIVNALAAIAVVEQQHERAAVLLAAAEQTVAQQGATWPPDEAEHFAHSRAAVTAVLDPAHLARAWSEGRSMTTDQMVAYAVTGGQPSTRPTPPASPAG